MENRSHMHAVFTRLFKYLPLGLVLLAPLTGSAERVRTETQSIAVDGNERKYIVYKPKNLPTNPPMMLVLHGGLGNAEAMRHKTQMDRVADKNGFIAVYANGVGGSMRKNLRTWNAGTCCGNAVKRNSNDTGYLAAIIDEMAWKYQIDTKRVYLTGFSNGAMMAYRMACERPEKVTAIVPVSGTIAINHCDGAITVPVLHIHGEEDDNVPFWGGKGSQGVSRVNHKSVDETLKIVKDIEQCTAAETYNLNANIQVKKFECQNNVPVVLYVLRDGVHEWPENASFSASETAWDFVKSHSK
jgi:polyhydroxybutyrate depolymerase